jgi:hypothetical protein
MGIAASWMSVGGLGKAEVLERLGIVETADKICLAEQWFDRHSLGGVAELPCGRVLLVARYGDLFQPETAAKVSGGAELVMCAMEEHVMYSSAWGYADGQQLWSIDHNPNKNLDGVDVSGSPPTSLAAAIARAKRLDEEEGGADYFFSVPMDVAGEIGRYRADEDLDDFDNVVTLVELKEFAERRQRLKDREAARYAAKAARSAAWKASGGLVGAARRIFGGR